MLYNGNKKVFSDLNQTVTMGPVKSPKCLFGKTNIRDVDMKISFISNVSILFLRLDRTGFF